MANFLRFGLAVLGAGFVAASCSDRARTEVISSNASAFVVPPVGPAAVPMVAHATTPKLPDIPNILCAQGATLPNPKLGKPIAPVDGLSLPVSFDGMDRNLAALCV